MNTSHVTVLGAGSWGTALAILLANNGEHVRLWARRPECAEALTKARENRTYLPGFELPETVSVTSELPQALTGAKLVVCALPSHGLREWLSGPVPWPRQAPVVSATKGLEPGTLKLMSEVLSDLVPRECVPWLSYLGGPSFAREVAQGMPTAVAVASDTADVRGAVQQTLTNDRFRVYTTDDVVGVELGGALKNVIAIAAGISDGLGFGHNTRAALISRGLAEIGRLAMAMGAHPATIAGLSGMGDLVVTCTGDLSRNRLVGLELGRGRPLEAILSATPMIAEGVRTAQSAQALAIRTGVEMPIVREVYNVLYEKRSPREAVACLMGRPSKEERD